MLKEPAALFLAVIVCPFAVEAFVVSDGRSLPASFIACSFNYPGLFAVFCLCLYLLSLDGRERAVRWWLSRRSVLAMGGGEGKGEGGRAEEEVNRRLWRDLILPLGRAAGEVC